MIVQSLGQIDADPGKLNVQRLDLELLEWTELLTSHIRQAFKGLSAGTSNCVPQATQMSRSSLVCMADVVCEVESMRCNGKWRQGR